MTVATFNGTDSDTIDGLLITRVRRTLHGAPRDSYVDVPGRAGAWLFPEVPGDRTIVLTCHLQGVDADDRRDLCREVAEWAWSTSRAPLLLDDEPDRYWLAKLASSVDLDEWVNAAAFELDFRAEPYAYSTTISTETWSATANVAHTWTPPDGIGSPAVVEFTPSGSVPDVVLTANGDVLTLDAGVSSIFTVSAINYTVLAGANTDTNLDGTIVGSPSSLIADVSGRFPHIVAGLNSFEVNRAGTVKVSWRRRYP